MENAPLHSQDETGRLFEERSGWSISKTSLSCWMYKNGIRTPAGRSCVKWDEEKDAYFAEIVPGHTESEIRELFAERFGIVLTEGKIGNRKTKLGIKSGTHGGCFKKGNIPPNKGRTWDEMGIGEESRRKMLATCFKKDNMPHNAYDIPVGTERVTKDGYMEVKVAERRTAKNSNDNWRPKHHLVWEAANCSLVPEHVKIVFADGDKANLDPENLVAVPNDLWSVISLKGIPYWDRESLELAMLRAKVTRARVKVTRRSRPCKRCGSEFAPRYDNQRTCDECLGRKKE